MSELRHEIELIRAQAKLKLRELEAQSPAKDVAGRVIGKQGLFYIAVMLLTRRLWDWESRRLARGDG